MNVFLETAKVLFDAMLAMLKSCLVPSHHACKHKGFSDLDMENPALHVAAQSYFYIVFAWIRIDSDYINWCHSMKSLKFEKVNWETVVEFWRMQTHFNKNRPEHNGSFKKDVSHTRARPDIYP